MLLFVEKLIRWRMHNMQNEINELVKIANKLDKDGFTLIATHIDDIIRLAKYDFDDSDRFSNYDPRYNPDSEDWLIDGVGFANEGSALRSSTGNKCPRCGESVDESQDSYCRHCGTKLNPRKHSCPSCGTEGVLTDIDVQKGYQCDNCADRAEGKWGSYGD
jgi:hypothetical protein